MLLYQPRPKVIAIGLGFGVIRDCEDDEGPEEKKSRPPGKPVSPFENIVMEMADKRECCQRREEEK